MEYSAVENSRLQFPIREKMLTSLSVEVILVNALVFALTFLSQDSVDYATLGASSKLAAILTTYPFQVC